MAAYLLFLFINHTYSRHFGLRILLNFAHGYKDLLTLKQKNNKFDRHHERGLFVVHLAKNRCILKLEILPSFL